MALQADGSHASSHVLAIGLSAFAYPMARRYARDHRLAFGASCALTVATHDRSLAPPAVEQRPAVHEEIARSTSEVRRCGS